MELIEEAVRRFGIVVHAFVLMDNHYHLVVETPSANLSAAMQPWAKFRDQHGDWGRDMVLWLGRKVCGAKLRELATRAGVTTEATVTLAVKRLEARMHREIELREKVKAAQDKVLNVKT